MKIGMRFVLATLLAGCADPDYPESDGDASLEPAKYVPVEARFVCGASEACVDYGRCCELGSDRATCLSRCGTCSDKDTLEPSFQCYPTTTGDAQ